MFAIPSFFGYNTTFVSTPVATAATGVGETSFTANWNAFAGASYYLLDVSTSSSFSSFVGSYQDFVVITNSQVVSGLTANTTYYYRLRAATGVDADAASFFSRVYTAGGALSYTEVSATETLVASLKANSLWTPMKAIYPMVGASAAACAQNLKSSSFTGTFTSGWTFASTGVTPNGSSDYMDTNLNENSQMSLNSCNVGIYTPSNNQTLLKYDFGVYNNNDSITSILFYANLTYFRNMNFDGGNTAPSNISGFWQNNRTSSSVTKTHFNNTIRNISSLASAAKSNYNYFLSALNYAGTSNFYGVNTISFAFISNGLTDTEADDFYTSVQAFQTTLSRQV